MPMIPTNALSSVMTSPVTVLTRENQTLSNFLASERTTIEQFRGKVDSFEKKLKNITDPSNAKGEYGAMRYPLDIGQTKEYTNVMRISTYETDLVALESSRSFSRSISTLGGSISEEAKGRLLDVVATESNSANVATDKLAEFLPADSPILRAITKAGTEGLKGFATPFVSTGIGLLDTNVKRISGDLDTSNDYQREFLGLNEGTRKLDWADIFLYCPPEVRVSYKNATTSQDFQSMNPYILPLSGKPDAISSYAKYFGASNVKKLAGVLPGMDESVLEGYSQSSMRQVINPMNVARFQGTERRSFQFDFVFYPKSSQEMASCYSIINHLKKYSHPTRADDGRFLTYPAEFQIEFLDAESLKPNAFLPVISKCALNAVDVVYGESVVMASFMPSYIGSGSPPTKITMSLHFTELEILTAERFSDAGLGAFATPGFGIVPNH